MRKSWKVSVALFSLLMLALALPSAQAASGGAKLLKELVVKGAEIASDQWDVMFKNAPVKVKPAYRKQIVDSWKYSLTQLNVDDALPANSEVLEKIIKENFPASRSKRILKILNKNTDELDWSDIRWLTNRLSRDAELNGNTRRAFIGCSNCVDADLLDAGILRLTRQMDENSIKFVKEIPPQAQLDSQLKQLARKAKISFGDEEINSLDKRNLWIFLRKATNKRGVDKKEGEFVDLLVDLAKDENGNVVHLTDNRLWMLANSGLNTEAIEQWTKVFDDIIKESPLDSRGRSLNVVKWFQNEIKKARDAGNEDLVRRLEADYDQLKKHNCWKLPFD
jgi:hypothetical protein